MLEDKLDEYVQHFNDGFPMYQLGRGRSDEEIIKIINDCLSHNKDAYEMGYLEDDNEVLY